MKKILTLVLCCLLFTGCVPQAKETTLPSETNVPPVSPIETTSPQQNQIPLNIFTPDENAENFNTIPTIIDELDAALIVELLIEHSMLEDGIQLNSIKLDKTQLNLDFNQQFLDQLNSCGTGGERMLIGTVVNTFLSVYEAETVYITVDGEIMESGHVIYDFPIGFIE